LEREALGKELATILAFSPPARYESGTSAVGSVGLVGSDFAAVAWDGKVHDTSVDLHDKPSVEKALAVHVGILRGLAHSVRNVSHPAFLGVLGHGKQERQFDSTHPFVEREKY
jgi:hypothetical protein